jgi:prepilin-type N-terminal cleavage/methylation domain-containing protein
VEIKKGFGLVELIIVLGIIGVLASLVALGVGSMRERARERRALQFSRSIHNWLVQEAVGVWSFDEGAGGEARDDSTTNVALDVNSAAWEPDGILRSALSFDGTSSHVTLSRSLFSQVPEKLSVSLWAKPAGIPSSTQILFAHSDNGEWQLGLDNTGTFFFAYRTVTSSGESWVTISAPGSSTMDKWHHIAATWDANSNLARIIMNGKDQATATTGTALYDGTDLPSVGGNTAGGQLFAGTIDELEVYAEVF